MVLRVLLTLLVVVWAATWSGKARAQEPAPNDVETARAAFLQGLELREKRHDFATAAQRFQAAYALVPTPRFGYELGRTLRLAGDLVGARAAFVAAMGLPFRPNESVEAKKARTECEAQAVDLEQRIPQVLIHLTGTGQVFVDGEGVRRETLTVARRLNPGQHVLQVQVAGEVKTEQTLTLTEGERTEVTLSSTAQAQVTPSEPARVLPLPNNGYQFPVARQNNTGTKTALLVASLVTGLVGFVPGGIALGYVKGAQDACNGPNGCDATASNDKTLAYAFAITTDVLWGAAIVCFIAAIAIPTYSGGEVVVGASATHGGGMLGLTGRF